MGAVRARSGPWDVTEHTRKKHGAVQRQKYPRSSAFEGRMGVNNDFVFRFFSILLGIRTISMARSSVDPDV